MDDRLEKLNEKALLYFSLLAAVFAFLTFSHSLLKAFHDNYNFFDFCGYYNAAKASLQGIDIYSTLGVGYHPFFYVFVLPFTHFNLHTASFLWMTFTLVVSFIIIKRLSGFIIKRNGGFSRSAVLFCLVYIYFSFQPVMEDLVLGQINILLLFLAMALFTAENNDWLKGLSLAAILLTKPQFLILVFFFLWKKEYRVIIYCLVFYCLLTLLSFIILGIPIHLIYFKKLFSFISAQDRYLMVKNNEFSFPCIFGFLIRLLNTVMSLSQIRLLHKILSFLLFIFTFRFIKRDSSNKNTLIYEIMAVFAFTLLVTPFTEEHHFILLIPLIAVMLFDIINHSNRIDQLLYVCSFLLMGLCYSFNSFPRFHSGLLSLFSMGKFYGLVLLYIVTIRLLNSTRTAKSLQSGLPS